MPAPIFSASSIPLSNGQGNLPNVQGAMLEWFQTLSFVQIVKSIVNFQVVETETTTVFQGVRQPFTAQQLLMKPEGQRLWKWETIHSFPDLQLKPDDRIIFGTLKYRVMQKSDWKEYGYIEYHIIEDYTP